MTGPSDIPFQFSHLGNSYGARLVPANADEKSVNVSGRTYKVLGDEAAISIIKECLANMQHEFPSLDNFVFVLNHSILMNDDFKNYKLRIPTEPVEISESARAELLANLDEDTRIIANKALEEIRYISFEEFQQGLESATLQLTQQIGAEEPFVVLYDPPLHKSGIWTTKLALPFLEKAGLTPLRIEGWSWFDNPELPSSTINTTVKHIVIFDDASYSGVQIRRAAEELEKRGSLQKYFPNARITLVIPYITQLTLKELGQTSVGIIHHECMKIFPEELHFECNNEEFKGKFEGATATYFQHKVAAGGHSTVPLVKTGLLKEIIPPYVRRRKKSSDTGSSSNSDNY